nr:hypothetical protein [Fretibacterium fastidiosum]
MTSASADGTSRPSFRSLSVSRRRGGSSNPSDSAMDQNASGGPCQARRPLDNSRTRSTSSKFSSWCVTWIRVTPEACTRRRTSSTSRRPSGSSIEVGSSRIRQRTRAARAPASATRCFSPPDRAETIALRLCRIPTLSRAQSTRA